MKKILLMCGLAVGLSAGSAQALPLFVDFCPANATCPAGVNTAAVVITAGSDAADDNDYVVSLILTVTQDIVPALYVDEVQFTLGGVQGNTTVNGYEGLPSLTFAPGGLAVWTETFDTISNNDDCDGDATGQGVCAESIGAAANGPQLLLAGNPYRWSFDVDLQGTDLLELGDIVNFRAKFVDSNGVKVGDLFSPADGALVGCASAEECPQGTPFEFDPIPEPTAMTLLGLGLLGAGLARRRK